MKKIIVTMLTILASGAAYALPVGNPSDASLICDGLIWEGHCGDPCDPYITWCDAFSIRLGFYGDYVFNRHLEVNGGDHSNIENTEIFTNAGSIAANFWDRFDIFTTLGTSSFCMDTNASSFNGVNGERFVIDSETHFSWSAGVRGTIWECGCTSLGAEAQYFFFMPDVHRITEGAIASVYPDEKINAKYREWQVGVGISHRINLLVPYIAIKWSRARVTFDDARPNDALTPAILPDLRNNKGFGYALGVSLIDCEKASLTIEARFGDEKAAHVNGQIRF